MPLHHAFSRGRCIVCGASNDGPTLYCPGPSTPPSMAIPEDWITPPPKAPAHDPTNHPTHYTSHPSGIECIEVTRHMSFNLGNAVKYIWRFDSDCRTGLYNLRDIGKAIWYLIDERSRLSQDKANEVAPPEDPSVS